jgi:fibronectin-binding autotransporter adhesin
MSHGMSRKRRWGWIPGLGWSNGPDRRSRRGLHPIVLALEDRRLLSTFTVINTDASGKGSLAQAIIDANGNNQANTIDFSTTAFSTPQTITLGGSVLDLTDTHGLQTITGPTAGVTISGGGKSGVFQIGQSNQGVTASLSGLTITDGKSQDGAGVYNNLFSTVTLTNCTISGNSASSGGGLSEGLNTSMTLNNCTIKGNSASSGGGGTAVRMAL